MELSIILKITIIGNLSFLIAGGCLIEGIAGFLFPKKKDEKTQTGSLKEDYKDRGLSILTGLIMAVVFTAIGLFYNFIS